jgi:hypothetical protein
MRPPTEEKFSALIEAFEAESSIKIELISEKTIAWPTRPPIF